MINIHYFNIIITIIILIFINLYFCADKAVLPSSKLQNKCILRRSGELTNKKLEKWFTKWGTSKSSSNTTTIKTTNSVFNFLKIYLNYLKYALEIQLWFWQFHLGLLPYSFMDSRDFK